jgi:PleD family two-component response regulator
MLPYTTAPSHSVLMEFLKNRKDRIDVLMIGNNPHEISRVCNLLLAVRSRYYFPDFCFDLKDALQKVGKVKPALILIDDNLDYDQTRKFIRQMREHARTRSIPIILLKNNNWNFRVIDQVDDYLLSECLSTEILNSALSNQLEKTEHQAA